VARPDEGSQPRPIAKTICNRSPNQNPGSETPTSDVMVVKRSNQRPRCTADQTPTGIVKATAHASDTPINSIVAGRRSSTRLATGRPSLKLKPQSPRTNAPSHDQYWCQSERSSPSARRSRSMSSGRTFGFER
jgi:hypothetical protein